MAKMLFSSADRAKAHARLEEVLHDYPSAECREDPNADEPFQVWDGPVVWVQQPPTEVGEVSDSQLDALAERLAAKLRPTE